MNIIFIKLKQIQMQQLKKKDNYDVVECEGTVGKEIVFYQGVQSPQMKPLEVYGSQLELKRKKNGRL